MATKKKKHAGGRPSTGLSEVRVDVPMPAAMRDAVDAAALRHGTGRSEWVRVAITAQLEREALESPLPIDQLRFGLSDGSAISERVTAQEAVVMKSAGQMIREARTAKNLSLRAVAEEVGISHVQLGNMERGASPVAEEYVRPLCIAIPGLQRLLLTLAIKVEKPVELRPQSEEARQLATALARRFENNDLDADELKRILGILRASKTK